MDSDENNEDEEISIDFSKIKNLFKLSNSKKSKGFRSEASKPFRSQKTSKSLGMSGKQSFPEHTPKSSILDDSENFQNKKKTAGRDRKSTRLNSSHIPLSRMPSSA